MASMANRMFSGILIGDELGFIKRLDFTSGQSPAKALHILNREFIGQPSPDKTVLSIHPMEEVEPNGDSGDDEDDFIPNLSDKDSNNRTPHRTGSKSVVDSAKNTPFDECKYIYLIASRPNHIYLYNSYTEQFSSISYMNDELNGLNGNLVGAAPIGSNNFVSCYENGRVIVHNIETDILSLSSQSKSKAMKLLGIETDHQTLLPRSSQSCEPNSKKRFKKDHHKPDSGGKSKISPSSPGSTPTTIFSPNWQPSNTCLTCFKVCDNRIAIGGKNVDLRVLDMTTQKCIFTARSQSKDFLGLRNKIWISDVDWMGPLYQSTSPTMISACSRVDPIVRVYDLRSKQRKPIWTLNFKDQTFNNDSNPPSFTKICSTSTPVHTNLPAQQLILGTTMGRLMAVDLRFNSHSYRHLGVFKSFGAGSIRDIKYVGLERNKGKIVSCSLDRFVRVHSFSTGPDRSRSLDFRYYSKTKPTCVLPILAGDGGSTDLEEQLEGLANEEPEEL
ncbi:WD repeat domain 74 lethal (2) k09848 [Brevipalpus obovatus]|uniref:WD repeat domain 74 lethal (2) k09848 n=1 Tax=Brevipalpus obovatus TaxID=246614 RepID=UPI003D9F08BE